MPTPHSLKTPSSCKMFPLSIVTVVLVSLLSACHDGGRHHSDAIPDDDEGRIYLLVGEPCSEGDYATAISRADSLLRSVEMSDSLRAFIMIDRDVALLESGDLSRAAEYADSVIDFGRKAKISLAVMQGLQNRGIVSRRNGDYDKAIDDYSEGLKTAMEVKDTEMEQIFAEMLAIACTEKGRTDEALRFARIALKITRDANDSVAELSTVSTLAAILARTGRYEESIAELLPYWDYASGIRAVGRVKYLTPLLKSYLALDSIEKTREVLDETYKALEGTSRKSQAYLVAVNAEAAIARHEHRYADQWRWLAVADSIGGMGTAPELILRQKAECLANLGRHAEAYDMECKAYTTLDSARIENDNSQLAELSMKYDTMKKEADIAKLKAQKLTWTLVALCCALAIAAGGVLLFAAHRRASRRAKIEKQKQYVRGLEQERQRIARELHDDIAGSLIGLQWQLQASNASDAQHLVTEIATRVRRMSHEMMPPEFRERTFTQMLTDMVARVNTYGNGKSVKLTDEGSFDWDSLSSEECLELYRLVQEAISNAFRHGSGDTVRIILNGDKGFALSVINDIRPDEAQPDENVTAGIRSMKARAAIMKADLSISTDNGSFRLNISHNN